MIDSCDWLAIGQVGVYGRDFDTTTSPLLYIFYLNEYGLYVHFIKHTVDNACRMSLYDTHYSRKQVVCLFYYWACGVFFFMKLSCADVCDGLQRAAQSQEFKCVELWTKAALILVSAANGWRQLFVLW